jgi:nucleoside-diphosphate-sugar epimerase
MDEVLQGDPSGSHFDAVVHAAAVRHRHGVDVAAYRDSNVALVERLLAAMRGRANRFILISSVGVYGFPAELPVSERNLFAPTTLYSQTKVDAERIVRKLAGDYEMEFTILRPTIIYGPGDNWGMLNKMVAMMRAGTYRIVGDGSNKLHHTFVGDVVDAILIACEHPGARNEDFIIAGPEPTTLEELSLLVAATIGSRLPSLHVPLSAARLAATLIDVAAYRGFAWTFGEPPISHEKLDVMTRSIWFDASKARTHLGFVARTPYREGIWQTLAALSEERG